MGACRPAPFTAKLTRNSLLEQEPGEARSSVGVGGVIVRPGIPVPQPPPGQLRKPFEVWTKVCFCCNFCPACKRIVPESVVPPRPVTDSSGLMSADAVSIGPKGCIVIETVVWHHALPAWQASSFCGPAAGQDLRTRVAHMISFGRECGNRYW